MNAPLTEYEQDRAANVAKIHKMKEDIGLIPNATEAPVPASTVKKRKQQPPVDWSNTRKSQRLNNGTTAQIALPTIPGPAPAAITPKYWPTATHRLSDPELVSAGREEALLASNDGTFHDYLDILKTIDAEETEPEEVKAYDWDLADAKKFGSIAGVQIGHVFKDRAEMSQRLVHRGLVAGIFGDAKVGAYSIVASEGYEKDEDKDGDDGKTFMFTGEGGRDLGLKPKKGRTAKKGQTKGNTTGKLIHDQTMSKGNLALLVSCATGKPVRVSRGYKHRFGPQKGYRYDGLYQVKEVSEQAGEDKQGIFRFFLVRMPGQEELIWEEKNTRVATVDVKVEEGNVDVKVEEDS